MLKQIYYDIKELKSLEYRTNERTNDAKKKKWKEKIFVGLGVWERVEPFSLSTDIGLFRGWNKWLRRTMWNETREEEWNAPREKQGRSYFLGCRIYFSHEFYVSVIFILRPETRNDSRWWWWMETLFFVPFFSLSPLSFHFTHATNGKDEKKTYNMT